MSRRLHTTEVQRLLARMEEVLGRPDLPGGARSVDGKPLVVGGYSKDREATRGHVPGGFARGYKLHAIYAEGPVPLAWNVVPLNVGEPTVAIGLISLLGRGDGYILGDSAYDSNPLHERAEQLGYQLLAPRKQPQAGLGHRHHAPSRLRSIALLQTEFGKSIYRLRSAIERQFGWPTNHATGLLPLPAWVRRIHRVQLWVQTKIVIHAMYARLHCHAPPLALA